MALPTSQLAAGSLVIGLLLVAAVLPTTALSAELVLTSSASGEVCGDGLGPDVSVEEQIARINVGPSQDAEWQPLVNRHPDWHGYATFVYEDVPNPLEQGYVSANGDAFIDHVDEVTYNNRDSAFYRFTFELPADFRSAFLQGYANIDDMGVVFLNGVRISAEILLSDTDPQRLGQDRWDQDGRPLIGWPTKDAFGTNDASHFRAGVNELVFAVLGDASQFEPTGLEFQASISYSDSRSEPEYYHLGVWGSGPDDVFVVGGEVIGQYEYYGDTMDTYGGTILHYDGSTWSRMETERDVLFMGVWGSGPNDVFAVGWPASLLSPTTGSAHDPNEALPTYIYHYDGSSWTAMSTGIWALPFMSTCIWGNGPGDVYLAVGSLTSETINGDTWYIDEGSGGLLHYDGSSWSTVPINQDPNRASAMTGVWGTDTTNIYAVGCVASAQELEGIVSHYDGSSWSHVQVGTSALLTGIWGSGPNDIFAVGWGENFLTQAGVVLHYDGAGWAPMAGDLDGWINGIWGSGPSDVFAVALTGSIYHYDGSSWSAMPSATTNGLASVWGSGANDVYAAGEGVILHYDGASWSRVGTDQEPPGPSPRLTVVVQGGGKVLPTGLADGPRFQVGAAVDVWAVPDDGWVFSRWAGDLSGTEPYAQITMDGDKIVTAIFESETPGPRKHALTVRVEGPGSLSVDDVEVTDVFAGMYEDGASVNLIAPLESPEGGRFVRWEGDVAATNPSLRITMDSDKAVTAVFEEDPAYTLTANAETGGTIQRSPDQGAYLKGTSVILNAVPDSGYHFSRWEGDVPDGSATTNPLQITMDADKTVTAYFITEGGTPGTSQHTLAINKQGQGTLSLDPPGQTYSGNVNVTLEDGIAVELCAEPATGWQFARWEGDVTGTNPSASVTMDADKSATAVFEQDTPGTEYHTLTIEAEGQGDVSPEPGQHEYPAGEKVTLTAEPAAGWRFVAWRDDARGSSLETEVTMNGSKKVTAVFAALDQHTLAIHVIGEGSVWVDPPGEDYGQDATVPVEDGTTVALLATPAADWKFREWQGDVSSSHREIELEMTEDRSVTVVFQTQDVNTEYQPPNGTRVSWQGYPKGEFACQYNRTDIASFNNGNCWRGNREPGEEDVALFDGDTTGTYPVHAIYLGDFRAKICMLNPGGISTIKGGATNRGLEVKSGNWTLILDSYSYDGLRGLSPGDYELTEEAGVHAIVVGGEQQGSQASLTLTGNGTLDSGGAALGHVHGTRGDVTVKSGATWVATGIYVGGTASVRGGKASLKVCGDASIQSNQVIVWPDGELLGTGWVVGAVVVRGGTLRPGCSPGVLTIDGDLIVEDGSVVEIEVAGANAGERDRLEVTGTARLGGKLILSFSGDAEPTGPYEFIKATATEGAFESVEVVGLEPERVTLGNGSDGAVSLTVDHAGDDELAQTAPSSCCAASAAPLAGLACMAGLMLRRPSTRRRR